MHAITYIFIPIFLILLPLVAEASVTIKTSEELCSVLTQDQDFDTIYLDNDLFTIPKIVVRAGGTMMPKAGREVKFVGTNEKYEIHNGKSIMPVVDFKSAPVLLTNADLIAEDISAPTFVLNSNQIERVDSISRTICIRTNDELDSLFKGLDKTDLKNCVLKLSYWYICADVTDIEIKGGSIYGIIDTNTNYKNLGYKYIDKMCLCFYNFPLSGDTYIDSDYRIVSGKDGTIRYFPLREGLILSGKRNFSVNDISFFGFGTAIGFVYKESQNKKVNRCTFNRCIKGVFFGNGAYNHEANISVVDSKFEEMLGSQCVVLYGCDNVSVTGCYCEKTGLVNKGNEVIGVAGRNCYVANNQIYAFSYNGIRIGNTRRQDLIYISGVIENNLIDNRENYGCPERCLNDGGGIYIFTHQNSTTVKNNVIRNIGYEGSALRGIFMDDGAYNTTIEGNLVYNIYDGTAISSRLVDKYPNHNSNNLFSDNICKGRVLVAGNSDPDLPKTKFLRNYVDGNMDIKPDVIVEDNEKITLDIISDKVKVSTNIYKEFIGLSPFVLRQFLI